MSVRRVNGDAQDPREPGGVPARPMGGFCRHDDTIGALHDAGHYLVRRNVDGAPFSVGDWFLMSRLEGVRGEDGPFGAFMGAFAGAEVVF